MKSARLRTFGYRALGLIALAVSAAWGAEDLLTVPGLSGRPGGRLISGERTEPKTFNPVVATDAASKNIINRMMADLVHINRSTLKTEPALAKSVTVSADGLRYELELRQGLRFSDGQPFDADDVVFTFQVYLDPQVNSPQRAFWLFENKPVTVKKLSQHRVAFLLPRANAVGDRMFDSVPILPRHLLEKAYREGRLKDAWSVRTPAREIAGMGPFRLKEYAPGQRVALERNPYYWKKDAAGNRLPYLTELVFSFAATEDMQVMRFQSGESDVISRVTPKDAAVLRRDAARRGLAIVDAGAGFEHSFLVFNLNASAPAQAPWRKAGFRKAVSAAIDRDAIVRLVYQGYAAPLASPVAAGCRPWVSTTLPKPVRSLERARALLKAEGFRQGRDGALEDAAGQKAAFSIITGSSNPERLQMATLIQDDMKALGIRVDVVPLESRSMLDRVTNTRAFDTAIMALASTDADPNSDMNMWRSNGTQHAWNPAQKAPATAWEAEIDGLMQRQMITLKFAERKRLFDRVQQIASENLPVLPLVSPNVLVGAKQALGNFRPAQLEPYALWNVEELYWREAAGGRK